MQVIRALVRRWYVALPLLLVTVAASLAVRGGVEPAYTVSANAVVVPPPAAEAGQETVATSSSITNFSATTQARALTILANSPAFQGRVAAGDELAAYGVSAAQRDPFLTVTTESKDPDRALDVASNVLAELQAELDRQQPGVTQDRRVVIQVLSEPAIQAVDDARVRAVAIAAAIGLVVTVVASVLVDGMALSRSHAGRRRARLPERKRATASDEEIGVEGAQQRPREPTSS